MRVKTRLDLNLNQPSGNPLSGYASVWPDFAGNFWTKLSSGVVRRINWAPRGAWAALTAYFAGDVVYLNGVTYVCILAVASITPPPSDATHWTKVTDSFANPMSNAGDIIVGGSPGGIATALPKGANNSFLGVNSSGNLAYGPAMVKIAEVVGTGASGVMEFSNIPQTYRALLLQHMGRTDAAVTVIGVALTFETTPTLTYSYQYIYAHGAAVATFEGIDQDYINMGTAAGTSVDANLYCGTEMIFPEYANTSMYKPCQIKAMDMRGLSTGNIYWNNTAGIWKSTSAITRIRLTLLSGNWTTTSRATLWGIPA